MKQVVKPRKKPRQARSRFMVDTILEATARVLAKYGYAGTNTNLIAETAGISVGSLYQYFPNKDSIVAAIHQRHVRNMRDMIIGVLSESKESTLEEAVKALVRTRLAAHLAEPELHRVLEVEFPFMDSEEEENEAGQDISKCLQELLRNYHREILRSNLEMASYMVLGIVKSLVHQAALEPLSGFTLPEIEAAICEAVMGYLTVSGPTKGKRKK